MMVNVLFNVFSLALRLCVARRPTARLVVIICSAQNLPTRQMIALFDEYNRMPHRFWLVRSIILGAECEENVYFYQDIIFELR